MRTAFEPTGYQTTLSWGLCFLYMGLIFLLSSRPHVPRFTGIKYEDFLLHIVEYGVLGFLVARAFFNLGVGAPVGFAFVFALFYGITDELHQSFVPGRNASIVDVLADGTGSLLGGWTFRTLQFRRRKASKRALLSSGGLYQVLASLKRRFSRPPPVRKSI